LQKHSPVLYLNSKQKLRKSIAKIEHLFYNISTRNERKRVEKGMVNRMEKGLQEEYAKFIAWRCKIAEENVREKAKNVGMHNEPDDLFITTMIECYKCGFMDRDKLSNIVV
jgi:hypothetical protein